MSCIILLAFFFFRMDMYILYNIWITCHREVRIKDLEGQLGASKENISRLETERTDLIAKVKHGFLFYCVGLCVCDCLFKHSVHIIIKHVKVTKCK